MGTIQTSWITLPDSIWGELIRAIITPPITPKIISGEFVSVISRKNCTFWSYHSQRRLRHGLHRKILTELIGVIHFTSGTPENSWGINCVILEGPMVPFRHFPLLPPRFAAQDFCFLYCSRNSMRTRFHGHRVL